MKLIRATYAALLLFLIFASCESYDNAMLTDKSRCDMAPDPGPCKAYIPKYYYDRSAKACKQFIWGGCYGVVPFDSMEECQNCLLK